MLVRVLDIPEARKRLHDGPKAGGRFLALEGRNDLPEQMRRVKVAALELARHGWLWAQEISAPGTWAEWHAGMVGELTLPEFYWVPGSSLHAQELLSILDGEIAEAIEPGPYYQRGKAEVWALLESGVPMKTKMEAAFCRLCETITTSAREFWWDVDETPLEVIDEEWGAPEAWMRYGTCVCPECEDDAALASRIRAAREPWQSGECHECGAEGMVTEVSHYREEGTYLEELCEGCYSKKPFALKG